MAFAGDNVVEEFESEKRLEEEGLDKAKEEAVLPGWGAWAGEGVKEKKKAVKVVEKPKVSRLLYTWLGLVMLCNSPGMKLFGYHWVFKSSRSVASGVQRLS